CFSFVANCFSFVANWFLFVANCFCLLTVFLLLLTGSCLLLTVFVWLLTVFFFWLLLTGSCSDQSRGCCKNGGTCILGSFCACPPFFTGRSCEYDQRIRRCGAVPHGSWVQKGCSYCRCGYGVLHCFPHVFNKDCGKTRPRAPVPCGPAHRALFWPLPRPQLKVEWS
uniref:EGF-like domain-containing protein n=1 Tax=Sphaeramia orbicularis TaxID=375764 RepID=A0A673ANT1_9TELE